MAPPCYTILCIHTGDVSTITQGIPVTSGT